MLQPDQGASNTSRTFLLPFLWPEGPWSACSRVYRVAPHLILGEHLPASGSHFFHCSHQEGSGSHQCCLATTAGSVLGSHRWDHTPQEGHVTNCGQWVGSRGVPLPGRRFKCQLRMLWSFLSLWHHDGQLGWSVGLDSRGMARNPSTLLPHPLSTVDMQSMRENGPFDKHHYYWGGDLYSVLIS